MTDAGKSASVRKKIVLIDGSACVFRAYYALPPLTTKAGLPVGAAYGFTLMLLKTLRAYPESMIAVAMDKDSREFRQAIDAQYKANRPPAPEDLKAQFPIVREIVEAFDIPVAEFAGYEADDVIATLVRQAVSQGVEATIITGDKDLMQLVSDAVQIYDPMKERRYRAPEVEEKLGVPPCHVTDYLALVGDASDNVPGVPKIGPKTAAQLIGRYGGIDGIYDHLAEIPGSGIRSAKSIAAELESHREQVSRALRLVTLQSELPITFDEERFARRRPCAKKLRAKLNSLEFYKLVADLSLDADDGDDSDASDDSVHCGSAAEAFVPAEILLSRSALEAAAAEVQASGGMTVLPVFDGADARRSRLLGVAFSSAASAGSPPRRCYVPTGHGYLGAPHQLTERDVLEVMRPLFQSASVRKTLHGLKRMHLWLGRSGLSLEGPVEDAELLSYLASADRKSHSLEALSAVAAGRPVADTPQPSASGNRRGVREPLLVEQAAAWAGAALSALDAAVRLESASLSPQMQELYRELEVPTAEVLAAMEQAGILVDGAVLRRLSGELQGRIGTLEAQAFQAAGETFNLNSPQQLAQVLFDKLGLPVRRKGARGPSVDQEVLESLTEEHPLPGLILERRTLIKLQNTYLDVLPTLVEADGRIHTTFHQTVTATGRLSSSDPNLQNIPVRTELGREVRGAFVAPPGGLLLSADYSQIELRVLAHLTEDEALVASFNSGEDIHQRTACEIFGVPPESVTAQMRRSAKTINFGIIYGLSAFGLAQRLGIPPKESQAMIDRYFQRYAGIRRWLDETVRQAKESGETRTLWGRVRRIPELSSRNHAIRQSGERMAVNAPVQGTAADLMKRAMVNVHRSLAAAGLKSRLLLQVHDELILEVPEAELDEVRGLVVRAMEGAASLRVPLVVGVGQGTSWAEAH